MAKQGFIGWLLGEPEDTYGGISSGDRPWLNKTKAPSIQEVRTGQRFRDGAERKVRDVTPGPNAGRYVGQTKSPRETLRIVKQERAKGNLVVVEKVQPREQLVEGSNSGCLVFLAFCLGSGSALLYETLRWII